MARGKKKETLTPEERLHAALVPASEQPYPVPGNWCWVRLKASINLYNGDRGTNYPSKKDYQFSGVPFINAGAIVDGELNEAEFNSDWIEASLAHVASGVRAVYNVADYAPQRRRMLQAWADMVDKWQKEYQLQS